MATKKEEALRSDEQLKRLGYEQQLQRGLGLWSTFSIGVATVAPVVGLYAIVPLGMMLMGPAWIWVLLGCLVFQLFTALVYGVLAHRYPIAGGPFQWARRLVGPRYSVFTAVCYVVAVCAALTTVLYLAAPWLSLLIISRAVTGFEQVLWGIALMLIALVVNARGVKVTKHIINLGIWCEVLASLGLGLVLIIGFRQHDFSSLFSMGGMVITHDGGVSLAAVLATVAVCGWAFVGFDAGASVAEETTQAGSSVPRAIVGATAAVGAIVLLVAAAIILSTEELENVISGKIADPILTAVTLNLGAWSEIPFLILVCVTFVACVLSMQTYLGRVVFSIAREGATPRLLKLDTISRSSKVPVRAMGLVSVLAACGLLLGLNPNAIGTMITFGTGGLYITFLLAVFSVIFAMVKGRWRPLRSRRADTWFRVVAWIAVVWLAFEVVNIAWPRPEIAAPGASALEVWAVIIIFSIVAVITLIAMWVKKPETYLRPLPKEDGV